jgi:cytochrome c oxidase subunit 4
MTEHSTHASDSLKTYIAVFAALMVLLLITVWVAFHHFGVFNPIIAVSIALVKAGLVIVFFMHVRHGSHLIWIFSAVGFYFLAIMIIFVLSDVLTRDMMGLTEMHAMPGPFEMLMQEDVPPTAPASPGPATEVAAPR